jgi:hypothetical protein
MLPCDRSTTVVGSRQPDAGEGRLDVARVDHHVLVARLVRGRRDHWPAERAHHLDDDRRVGHADADGAPLRGVQDLRHLARRR